MSKRAFRVLGLLAAFLVAAISLNGCAHPTRWPGLKQVAEKSEAEAVRYTAEALKDSPGLQELDRLCGRELPLYEGFVLRSKLAAAPRYTSLGYTYLSDADYRKVRGFYLDYFRREGWQVVEDKEGGWGPRWSGKFRRGNYKVVIVGGGIVGADYGIDCEKLSDSGGPLPNNGMHPTAGTPPVK